MISNTDPYFDMIDVENLFQAWHPDIRKFTTNLNQNCVLESIKEAQITDFPSSKFNTILNLVNTSQCKQILSRIVKEKTTEAFIETLKERDVIHPREIQRGFSVEQIFEKVKTGNYHPILFLNLNNENYIIDGRTRFYCSLFLKKPAKIRTIFDIQLMNRCY